MPPKKKTKVFSRRLQSGWPGCPTKTFWHFKDHARTDLDKKEVSKTIKQYVKDNFSKEDAKIMLNVPEWFIASPYHIAATIEWQKLGFDFPDRWDNEKALEN